MTIRSKRWLAVALFIAPITSGAEEGVPVSFESDLLPVLKARCAVCHMTGKEPGGMALTPDKAWADLVSRDALGVVGFQRVAAGDPESSYLMHELWGSPPLGGWFRDPYADAPASLTQVSSGTIC